MVDEEIAPIRIRKVKMLVKLIDEALCRANMECKPVELLVATQVLLNRMTPQAFAIIVPKEALTG